MYCATATGKIVKVGEKDVDHIACSFGGDELRAPIGAQVTNYLLRIHADEECDWGNGVLGSCTIFARTASFRKLFFDEHFRRGSEIDFAIRAGKKGFHFISSTAPVIVMYKTIKKHKSSKIDRDYWIKIFES